MTDKKQMRQNTKDGSTLHITFDLSYEESYNKHNKVISYTTADNIGILVQNDEKGLNKDSNAMRSQPKICDKTS